MLRVGLTGGLGSGKSAVAMVFAEGGAHVSSADEIGRALMQPGGPVYRQIVEHFGTALVAADGLLDRRALAREAFEHGRLAELNAIVHPAVFRAQEQEMLRVAAMDPEGIAVIESALIFELARGEVVALGEPVRSEQPETTAASWARRFDQLVLVTAPDELKIARYVTRAAPPDADEATRQALAHDARGRLAAQIPDAEKAPLCDFVIHNTATLVLLRRQAQAVLAALRRLASATTQTRPGYQ
jgi:dephospho-CoA kinase